MKKNAWNIRRLVFGSLGQMNQRMSVIYYKLTNFLSHYLPILLEGPKVDSFVVDWLSFNLYTCKFSFVSDKVCCKESWFWYSNLFSFSRPCFECTKISKDSLKFFDILLDATIMDEYSMLSSDSNSTYFFRKPAPPKIALPIFSTWLAWIPKGQKIVEWIKSLFLPKYEPNIVRTSAL